MLADLVERVDDADVLLGQVVPDVDHVVDRHPGTVDLWVVRQAPRR